jgi:glycosyltransferase involved in cell wall biosynthesis
MTVNQTKRAIFTICSGNYFPYARVLLSSLQIYHPEASLFLCLADTVQVGVELNLPEVEVIPVDSLDILSFADFAFRYDIMEFNTAVKPFVMQWLMEVKGFEEIVYLDPDIELFAPMTPVFDAFSQGANFVLTPHLTEPAEFGFPDDLGIMKAGIYNLGFMGVKNSRDGISFLHWWGRRLRFQCLNRQDRGLFVDQKFVDLLPAFHDRVTILRDRSLNVAYWNLDRRDLTKSNDLWLIDGKPLRFFHFSGIDLQQPHRLSKHTTRFNGDLKPALQEIVRHYLDKLVQFNYGVELSPGYGYGKFDNGIAIASIIRSCYCDLTELWLENPFQTFQNYLNLPSKELFDNSPWFVTNLMYYIWLQRRDLQQAFNLQKDSNNCLNYCYWFIENAAAEYALDNYFITPIVENLSQHHATRIAIAKRWQNNVCVIGYLKAETGVGHAGRMVASSLKTIGIPTQGYNVTLNLMARQTETIVDNLLTEKIKSPIQIYNINADQLGLVRNYLKKKINQSAYKINMPFWELSKFPQPWLKNYQGINEVWAASRFIQATLQKVLSIPVFWLPPAVTLTKFIPRSRHYFQLPHKTFLFHYNFDFSSFATRKNPQAAIKAYRLAFRNAKTVIDTALVIKTRGYDPEGKSLARLQEFTANEPDIYILNQDMTYDETLALTNCCDCYISLHRSEGFGYTLAEAMLLEKPIIATDYSGTKDFLNQNTGFPVNYQLIPVQENEYPFWQHQTWADPDLNHAAWLMRKMIADEAQTKAIALQGKAKILTDYSLENIGKMYRERLKEIGTRG